MEDMALEVIVFTIFPLMAKHILNNNQLFFLKNILYIFDKEKYRRTI